MSIHSFHILEGSDISIDGSILYYKNTDKKPLTIILHGFKASSNWGFFPLLAKMIAREVGISLIFDFSYNGKPDRNYYFKDAEKFSRNTITRQIEDLKTVICKYKSYDLITRDVLDKIWNGQIFLLGHSLGAGIAFIYNKFFDNIDKISAWAPIAYLDRYSDRQKEIWKKNGYIEFQVNQTNQTLRMNLDYLLDIENNAEKYSIIDSVKNLSIPLQIIYGQEDLTITKYERNILTSNLNHNDVSIIYINNTGHTFGYSSNKREIGKGFKEALKQTIEFFNK